MSHGAAGFAYALSSLAEASGREDFADAAAECIAFEDSSYDAARHNWPDLRGGGAPAWPCQWCHGAPGIGLARLGMQRGGKIARARPSGLRRISATPSPASNRLGPATSIRCAAARSAGSNSSARRRTRSRATILRELAARRLTACSADRGGDRRLPLE